MKRSLFQHIKRGCGNLPHCGPHPGTEILFTLIAVSACPGILNLSLTLMRVGVAAMSAILLPVYLTGAYQRSVMDDTLSYDD